MISSPKEHSVVAVYATHAGAEGALKAIQREGIDMRKLSIVGKGFHTEEHALGFYNSGDRMRFWGGMGAFWGSIWGMLFGSALFVIPAFGPLIVMGPLVGWIAGVLEGAAVGGASGVLAAGLASIGVPKDSIVKYELQVKAGRFLVLAHGGAELVEHARRILLAAGAAEVTAHANPTGAPDHVLIPAHSRSSLEAAQLAAHATRDAVLMLLSDQEVGLVSSAETAAQLGEGEEYLDLEQLDLGVRKTLGTSAIMGHVLPRRVVHDATWAKILHRLGAPSSATPVA